MFADGWRNGFVISSYARSRRKHQITPHRISTAAHGTIEAVNPKSREGQFARYGKSYVPGMASPRSPTEGLGIARAHTVEVLLPAVPVTLPSPGGGRRAGAITRNGLNDGAGPEKRVYVQESPRRRDPHRPVVDVAGRAISAHLSFIGRRPARRGVRHHVPHCTAHGDAPA